MKVGIVGITNCGKTTLFNVLTGQKIQTLQFSSGSMEPNLGKAVVPDPRFTALCGLFNPKKEIPATVDFIDVPGLVKGASKGEGMGNQFLSHLRNCDALLHVIRSFKDPDVLHPADRIDPAADLIDLNYELLLSDLQAVENRIEKITKKGKIKKEEHQEYELMLKCRDCLENEKALKDLDFSDDELFLLKSFAFLTLKPQIAVANIDESDLSDYADSPEFKKLCAACETMGLDSESGVTYLAGRLEMEIMDLDPDERTDFLQDYSITETGRDKIIRASYDRLGLMYFFTVGEDEVRAWTVRKNATAHECAGAIHSDLARGFIRAEVVKYDDMTAYKTMKNVKDAGKFRLEGKEYIASDGDIIHVRFNV
jgi:GTP-binding protein YchF